MPQAFNPRRILSLISNSLLREFFKRWEEFDETLWHDLAETEVEPIFEAWQRLPEPKRRGIEAVLHDIYGMATDEGTCAIVQQGLYQGEDLLPAFARMKSHYDKVVWAFIHRPKAWHAAFQFSTADALNGGRSWIKRGDVSRISPKTDAESIAALQNAVSAFHQDLQGRGDHCRIEYLPRGKSQHYFFVYLSNYPDVCINFDEAGQFQRTAERRAFEIVFAYEETAGTLEMYVKGGKKVIEPLQQIFSRIILGERLPPEKLGAAAYRLNGLMDRSFSFVTDPEDGIEEVSLRGMRLSILGQRRDRITLEPDSAAGRNRIYEMLEEDLNSRRLPKSILNVTRATINFKLDNKGYGRSLTFNVSTPNSCTLKSEREDRRALGEKYLKRWGIDVA